jgi:Fe-S cluster assembly ATP-binding protein
MSLLEIKNLKVCVDGKEVLKGLNLEIDSGDVNVLMGPNGSGKSTLANVLMGNSKYKVLSGEILFNGENITFMEVHERARRGIFLSFQNPIEVPGVTIRNMLKTALGSIRKEKMRFREFKRLIEGICKELGVGEDLLSRYLNEGFSGGEKKKIEILQLLVLNPKFAILDETDSGLDIDALRTVSKGINNFMKKDKGLLMITHYRRILDHVKPDKIFVLKDGRIVLEGDRGLVDELEEKGYGWIED